MNKALACAVRLLTRREHGASELLLKLKQKGYDEQMAQAALSECQRLGFQSDQRFAESICRTRVSQGYGPVRIVQELKHLQIDGALIEAALIAEERDWTDIAHQVWTKKYKAQENLSPKLIEKQKNFLLYRGFSRETITRLYRDHLTNALS